MVKKSLTGSANLRDVHNQAYPAIGYAGFHTSRERLDGKVLLFVDYAVPMYDKFAGSRTDWMYLELLVELGLTVKFLPADFKRVEPYSTDLNKVGIETLDGDDLAKGWLNWLQEHGKEIAYVFFNKPDPTSMFLQAVRSSTRAAIIYQCHDLHYLRLQRRAKVENDMSVLSEARRSELQERSIFERSDVVLTFSKFEEWNIKREFPNKRAFTVPLYFYRNIPDRAADFHRRHGLVFVGSCAHLPNRDAIAWFCMEVFPLVEREIRGVSVYVVGANPTDDILALQSRNIRVVGGVTDTELAELYGNVRISVIPLRYGAGVKGKTIEALYHGVPIVSSSIGLEGLEGIEDIAMPQDDNAGFAEQIVSLYNDEGKWTKVAKKCTDFCARRFTWERAADQMHVVLDHANSEAEKRLTNESQARLIAFYLPQFHPIPENDTWWGDGFTEWRNVGKADSLFPGHYQPHIPADLGFYDLRLPEARAAQAELAREYGVYGFCYYHYWFNGRRLLERPLEEMYRSGSPDFPYCVCWANENWTRRWDGEDQLILLEQTYSEEDDRIHIKTLFRFFRDERYIRVNGKPLFLVYRTENMPNPGKTAEIWRREARMAGIGDLYLVRVESIGKCDPKSINFDAALEFAPDWANRGKRLTQYPPKGDETREQLGKYESVFRNNHIHTYDGLAEAMLGKPMPGYKWMRCVTPSWDNTARRKEGAIVFSGASPEKYGKWLAQTIQSSNERLFGDERIVFINAWNEWAEGNHLEPDIKFGRRFLEATRDALERTALQRTGEP